MAKIISETKVEECQKFEHTHKGMKGMNSFLKGLLFASEYCPECGEYLRENRPITTEKCSSCGECLLSSDLYKYKFCPKCGVKFEEE